MHPSEEPDWNSSMTSSQNKCPSPMTLWCCPAESSPDRSGPVLTSAKLYTVLWIWSNENWVRKGSLFSQSADYAAASAAQDILVCFGYKAHCWLMSHLLPTGPHILFWKATFQPINFQTIFLQRVIPSQVLDCISWIIYWGFCWLSPV